jgi:hypothetical protein
MVEYGYFYDENTHNLPDRYDNRKNCGRLFWHITKGERTDLDENTEIRNLIDKYFQEGPS